MKYKIKIHGAEYEVQIHKVDGNMAQLTVNDVEFEVEIERLAVNPTRMGDQPVKTISAETAAVKPVNSQPSNALKSPLPGTILDISVKEGDKVEENQILLILEAMKMENNIQAGRKGVVEKILCNKGDTVMEGDILLIIK